MYRRYLIYPLFFIASAFLHSCVEKMKGCTDPAADNFDLHADEDDGSCITTDPIEGDYRFSGTRFGTSTTQVQDTFHMTNLKNGNYKIEGLFECNNVQLKMVDFGMQLVSSDCGISNWQFSFSSNQSVQMSFSQTGSIQYTGQGIKLP